MSKKIKWNKEVNVDFWVTEQLQTVGLQKDKDFYINSGSSYLQESLLGASKTEEKTGMGILDIAIEKYNLPIIIEDKLNPNKLLDENKDGIKLETNAIKNFAVNGAIYYAQKMIESGLYEEVIAIGVAGDEPKSIQIQAYYVFGYGENAYKKIEDFNFNVLESEETFNHFYQEKIQLTPEDKHRILENTQEVLANYAKQLNKLMHNLAITAPQRVLYISGMLLSMQDIGEEKGLTPKDLKGSQLDTKRDGVIVYNTLSGYLDFKRIPPDKKKLMLASFQEIKKDVQRDEKEELDNVLRTTKKFKSIFSKIDKVEKQEDAENELITLFNNFYGEWKWTGFSREELQEGKASKTKQLFVFLYENIYLNIAGNAGHLDIMGELYSEFLKYAMGDGKELGIVLTPPYVTKMMTEILEVNEDSRVMDLATGSAGFLISAMEHMIELAEKEFGKSTKKANKKIENIKKNQLLGVELNAEMYTLATTNMILRGDGSAKIEKGSAFNRPEKIFEDFKATRLLLNPPFTFKENGMPFIAYGLDKMEKGGRAAIIIQDSAGSGQAIVTNREILNKHQLLTSIKMPIDLFVPMAGVQTSIYVFEAHVKKGHDFEKPVRFIDFRQDGYKRAKRSVTSI
ncbi:N-6 DNA methylase [Pseudolactococcus yaeyamensis]